MITDIFIRTYKGDLQWLSYCLRSLQKFATGFRDIVIVIPQGQQDLLSHLTKEKIYTCPVYHDDYVGQQLTKLNAYQYTNADCVLIIDSDSIFTSPFTPEDYIRDGKPIIIKENYERLKEHKDCYARKETMTKHMGFDVEYEYMRMHPFVYRTQDIRDLGEQIPKLEESSEGKLMTPEFTGMSEFNILGATCDKYAHDKYIFLEVGKDEIPYGKVKQFRSWDGITKDIEKQIEECLR